MRLDQPNHQKTRARLHALCVFGAGLAALALLVSYVLLVYSVGLQGHHYATLHYSDLMHCMLYPAGC